jgi:hypothetical protein
MAVPERLLGKAIPGVPQRVLEGWRSLTAGQPTTADQVRTLADCFHTPLAAAQLLERAGLARRHQPSWNTSTSEAFWWEVHTLLRHGKTAYGWDEVLRLALTELPNNPVLTASAITRPQRLERRSHS